ncbi:MAG: TolC family protein [Bacteroidota bacterium]|nr:TolC family protein [Bacteroidota bacterium]
MSKLSLPIFCLLLLSFSIKAQETWNLERCIREALDKSLSLRQVSLFRDGYEIDAKRLRMERLPSLNASSDIGVSFGRRVNPVTNDFETDNSFYQSVGLNSGVVVFNGFRIRNSIRQNDLLLSASKEDILQAENDLGLNVALAYLNVLFAYENLEIAQARVGLTQKQIDHLDKQIKAGSKPDNDMFELLAQVAADEQSIVTAQNNIEINVLSLKQQMLMEPDYPLVIERPQLDLEDIEALENQSFDAVYTASLSTQPQIAASEKRQQAEEFTIDIARSALIPSLTLGGNIGSNWSDLAKETNGFIIQRIPQQGVFINGQPTVFEIESEIPSSFSSIPYVSQLDNNLGYGVGASVNIPIFNNYSGKAGVERAKIGVVNSQIETELVKQTLKTNVQNAIASARAARKSLDAAEASVTAARIALQNADRLSELGSLNNFEYLSARNRFDTAELNLLINKYDYIFKVKVIEYYLGRGIQLN